MKIKKNMIYGISCLAVTSMENICALREPQAVLYHQKPSAKFYIFSYHFSFPTNYASLSEESNKFLCVCMEVCTQRQNIKLFRCDLVQVPIDGECPQLLTYTRVLYMLHATGGGMQSKRRSDIKACKARNAFTR